MKVLINSLGRALSFPLLLLVIANSSCKKDPITPNSVPPVPPTTPISLDFKADTAWWDGDATITITTNAKSVAMNGQSVSGSTVVIKGMHGDSALSFVATLDGKSLTKNFTVHGFSEKTTILCKLGSTHLVYSKSCDVDSVAFASAWFGYPSSTVTSPPDCNSYQFFPNGTIEGISGSCNADAGRTWIGTWSLQNNETEMLLDGSNVWKLDSVNANGWQRSHLNTYNGITYINVQRYSHE